MITLALLLFIGLIGLLMAIVIGILLIAGTVAAVPLIILAILDAIIFIKIIKKSAGIINKSKTKKKKK